MTSLIIPTEHPARYKPRPRRQKPQFRSAPGPAQSFEQFKQQHPGTKLCERTYCAMNFRFNEVTRKNWAGGIIAEGEIVRARIAGNPFPHESRVVLVTSEWVWVVPESYPEEYWK